MRPPDLLRLVNRLAPWVVAVSVVAGCAGGGDRASSASPAPPATGPARAEPGTPARDESHDPAAPSTTAVPASPAASVAGTVTVSGGDLPTEIADAYRAGGGDLVDPAEWTARYGTAGLPELAGPGVQLAEATLRADRHPDGWHRTDEAAWLAITTAERDQLLATLATAAGIDAPAARVAGTDDGGDCVTDTYPPDRHGVVWTVQGCSYPRYPQMVAVGIARTGPATGPPDPVDPTLGPLTDLLYGEVSFVEVRLAAPGPDAATLHISAHVTLPTGKDITATAEAALTGPLAGWQALRGDASVLLSGPTGATWTLADGVAVFDWAGRW